MIGPFALLHKKRLISAISAAALSACLFSGCMGWGREPSLLPDANPDVSTPQPVAPPVSSSNPASGTGEKPPQDGPGEDLSPTDGKFLHGSKPGDPDEPSGTDAGAETDFVIPPEREQADDEFFSDAAFVGNSLMDGFRLFSGLTTCDYYAVTSMTVVAMNTTYAVTLDNGASGTIMQALAQKEYGKVYILLGINEIGYDVSYFKELYGDMLDDIAALQPNADIYIFALTPVSAYKSSTSDIFNMNRVNQYNTALYELAEEKGCYYMDICTALAGDDGFLPSEVTSDGVHFAASHYLVWLEYVKTHYA